MPRPWMLRLAPFLAWASIVACSPSDVGNQSDPDPVAVANVLGLGEPVGSAYQARASSDVAISAKDSDSDGAPILEYEWTQTGGPTVQLFERDNVTRTFTAPSEAATLEFSLTVTDANGVEATDTVLVDVVPVLDDETFLRDPSVEETLFLFVSPDPPAPTVAATIPYSITVTPTVFWTDRSGTPRSQTLAPVLAASGQLDAGFTIPVDPVDTTQDRIALPIPLLDIDEVNAFFQGANRSQRLELEEVRNARVELTVDLIGTGDFQVHAGLDSGATYTRILSADLVATGETPLGTGALLDGVDSSVRLDLESIRLALDVESFRSASRTTSNT